MIEITLGFKHQTYGKESGKKKWSKGQFLRE